MSSVRRFHAPARDADDFHWNDVETLRYKQDGEAPFLNVTRQVLFDRADMGCQLRYFEVAAGGYSTLERHEHAHAVLILRGRGRVLLGDRVHDVAENDLVTVDPLTWHQFRAASDAPLGFLCMVNQERDRPQLPSEAERARLARDPEIARFLTDKGDGAAS